MLLSLQKVKLKKTELKESCLFLCVPLLRTPFAGGPIWYWDFVLARKQKFGIFLGFHRH